MLSFNDIRAKAISTFIAKKNLDSGVLPSLDYITSQLLQNYDNTQVYKSMIKNEHYIEPQEIASSAKINSIQDAINIDINTLYEFIKYLSEYISSELKNVSNQINSAHSELDRLHKILDNKLLRLQSSAGLFDVENIDLFNNIILSETDTSYDPNSQIITISKTSESVDIDVNSNLASIRFSPVTTPYLSVLQYPNYSFDNLFDNSLYSEWISSIFMSTAYVGSVEGRLDLNFKSQISINSIKMIFASINTNLTYSICIKTTINGATSLLSPYSKYTDTAIIDFSSVETDNLSIYIITDKYSSISSLRDAKEYKFTLLSLSIGSIIYKDFSTHTISYSKQLYTKKSYSLLSEDIIPSDCKIEYYIVDQNGPSLIVPLNHGMSDHNYYGSSSVVVKPRRTAPIDLTISDPNLYGSNIGFSTPSTSDYKILLRGLNTFIENDKTLSCSLFNYNLNSIIDFSKTPGYLNDKYVNSKVILNEYFYTFTFENNSNNITPYFDNLDAWKNTYNGYYGSAFAYIVDLNRFLNIVEDDDITKYHLNYIKKSTKNINRANDYLFDKETILLIDEDSSDYNTTSKIVIKLYSSDNKTPIVKQLKMKSSQ